MDGAQTGRAFVFPLLWLLACRGGRDMGGCGRDPQGAGAGKCLCLPLICMPGSRSLWAVGPTWGLPGGGGPVQLNLQGRTKPQEDL